MHTYTFILTEQIYINIYTIHTHKNTHAHIHTYIHDRHTYTHTNTRTCTYIHVSIYNIYLHTCIYKVVVKAPVYNVGALATGQIVVCPVTLRRKEIQEWRREYWWVSRSLMTARKIALEVWVRTWKKIVANDRAGIKHLTLKFRGPVGQGGMNKWWKNELLKEH